MIIWFKNSFLASVVSILGCSCALFGILGFSFDPAERSMPIIVSVILFVIGALMVFWGKSISEKKEMKKNANQAANVNAKGANSQPRNVNQANVQPQQPAAATAVPPSPAVNIPPRPAVNTVNTPAYTNVPYANQVPYNNNAANNLPGNKIGASAIFAGIFFILSSIFIVLTYCLAEYYRNPIDVSLVPMAQLLCGILLIIASFVSKHTNEVSVLHLLGFLGLTVINAVNTFNLCRIYEITDFANIPTNYLPDFYLYFFFICSYFLMSLFTIFSFKNCKRALGIIVRIFWLLPFLVLALDVVKLIHDNYVMDILSDMIRHGNFINVHYAITDTIAQLFMLLAVLFTGYVFQRVCKKSPLAQNPVNTYVVPNAVPYNPQAQQQYVQQPVYQQPVAQPVAQPVVQENPEVPEAVQPASANTDESAEKTIRAYKDLLDCGIISQEEFDQKIRELNK